jgi:hypothetical protein
MLKIHPSFNHFEKELHQIIEKFDTTGELFVEGKRNRIKLFKINDLTISVKSFKKPHFVNQIIYRFFRKSKAQRSFEYATKLTELYIGTPQPIAYYEEISFLGLKKSFYMCQHITDVFEYRELVQNPNIDNHEKILRQFTNFCVQMHKAGIEFKDHSPGNTLIKDNKDNTYSFYLVDLNRMNFHEVFSFEKRMKNLSRLTPKKDMVAVMSNEYAKLYNESENKVFDKLWNETQQFQERFFRKKRIKKTLKFWKK